MSKNQVYVATETFNTVVDGNPVLITAGVTRVREGHELLRANPGYFEPLTAHFEVEDARNAPPPAKKSSPSSGPAKKAAPRKRAAKKAAAKKAAEAPAKKAESDKGSDEG